ncbi:MAG: hypothetical protein EBS89_02335 [Proteobacteria bacterium]|nr:hypothetical protein [Pseudomonadota bacterium]
MAIIAQTRAGKSYRAGKVLEELGAVLRSRAIVPSTDCRASTVRRRPVRPAHAEHHPDRRTQWRRDLRRGRGAFGGGALSRGRRHAMLPVPARPDRVQPAAPGVRACHAGRANHRR